MSVFIQKNNIANNVNGEHDELYHLFYCTAENSLDEPMMAMKLI